ncbi:50S ribosomal protein L17 [Calditrichota bacterium]
MHNKIKGRKLGRTASHRKALLRNLANQVIEHKEIRTTTAKAKEARSKVERLITYAKKGQLHHRRLAFAFLRNKQSINTLFDEIAPVYAERQGGYTRVVKLGRRSGDGAELALLQLVDFEKLSESKKPEKKKTVKKKGKEEKSTTKNKKTENLQEDSPVESTETKPDATEDSASEEEIKKDENDAESVDKIEDENKKES